MSNPITHVSVIVPFFKRQPDLEVLLASFRKLDLTGIELEFIVVEDGSGVANKNELSRYYADLGLKFLTNTVNCGPGYSRNLAAHESLGDYLWFLDSDTEIVRPNTLHAMIAALGSDSRRVVAGGSLEMVGQQFKMMVPVTLPNFQFIYQNAEMDEAYSEEVPFLSTCNFFIAKEKFAATGGFDTTLKMFEDNEMCFRLLTLNGGGTFHQSLATMVYHTVSSRGRDDGTFGFFGDRVRYLSITLHSRNILLGRYRRKLMAVLPLADVVGAILIARGAMAGRWNSWRMGKAKAGSRLRMVISTLLIIAYFQFEALWMLLTSRVEAARREPSLLKSPGNKA